MTESYSPSRPGPRGVLAVLSLCLAAALSIVGPATSKPAPRATRTSTHLGHAAAAGTVGFSHAVIVDEQRPGFEPDVKVDSTGQVFTSVPFGFSTTQSFVWSSRDHANSYQLTPGNIGPGKPSTCVGGGDTDLFLDSHDALYFSDLQGLTNISNSVSSDGGATWSTNCAGAPNAPDDRMWFTGTGSLAGSNLNLYQDYDAVDSSASGGNQLVETISHDGTTFTPVVNTGAGADCLGGGLYDCVTSNEGISGNQVTDPSTGDVYIAHTTSNGAGVQVSEGKITAGTPTTATWSESPNLDAALCADASCTDSSGNAEEIAGENFASIARDSAGYLYVTFTAGPVDHANSNDANFGALTQPEQIYVVRSLEPTGANPSALTWSAPQRITGTGASAGTNTFPWITAGSDGRVDVAYYHAPQVSQSGTCASGSGTCTLYGASSLSNAEWTVQMAQSLNAHSAAPGYASTDVSEAPVKHGQICTNGIGCATGGDRSLGDFLQVSTDAQGAALVSYVFDTSADSAAGEDAGPEAISRQISGPSLFASVGTVNQNGGPGLAMGSVSDPTGDADYSANGSRTAATPNLDLTGASLANGAGGTLDATLHVKDLSSLAASSAEGGPDASWLLRWTVVRPGTTGNGDIYYVGMDNNAGAGGSGSPTFFAGDTAGLPPANAAEHTKYMTFPQTHVLTSSQASYDKNTGTITFHVPLADIGSPPNGTVLYSATGFSATSTAPQSSTNLFNLIDATTPFELVIGAPGTGAGGGRSGASSGNGRCMPSTGRLSQSSLARLSLGTTRARARHIYPRWSSRGRKDMDFYCLRPTGVRGGYPSATLLRRLSKAQRRRVNGRAILLLTAGKRYALRGVKPGTKLTARLKRRLRAGHPYYVGKNTWYVLPNGRSHGVLKVRRGRIEEVGIADKRLTANRAATRRFLRTFY